MNIIKKILVAGIISLFVPASSFAEKVKIGDPGWTGATAIADAVEESAVMSAGTEVAAAVAGESLELHVHKESSTEHEHDRALEAVQAIEALSWGH